MLDGQRYKDGFRQVDDYFLCSVSIDHRKWKEKAFCWVLLMQKESSIRKRKSYMNLLLYLLNFSVDSGVDAWVLVFEYATESRLSSLTLSSVSVLEYNLSRTERRLCCDQFTKRGLVLWNVESSFVNVCRTSSLFLRVMLWEIFLELGTRLSRFLMFQFQLSTRERSN